MRTKMMIPVALVFILAACLPAQAPLDVEPIVNTAVAQAMATSQSQIEQSVALTVAAQQPQFTATSQQVETVTSDVSNEATPTPEFTPTPFLVASSTPIRTLIPLQYTCTVINRKPKDNTTFNRNANFDVKWTVVNTGTRAWPAGIDIKFVSGTQFTKVKRFEIPKALKPGESFEIILDANAPAKKGYYVMTWLVDGPMCYAYAAINVK